MLNRIRKAFRPAKIESLPLTFSLDEDEAGQHLVRATMRLNGQERPVEDMAPLLQYGYQHVQESESGTVVYRLTPQDQQTILALVSLNPQKKGDHLIFDIVPPVLAYLRTKKNVVESAVSQQTKISDKPLQPAATIDFVPGQGMNIRIGYKLSGEEALIPAEKLQETSDPNYLRAGNTFVPRPKALSERARQLLERPMQRVPLHHIPEFFQRDLVLLRREFSAVLTDLASQIQVIEKPLRPVVKVDKNEKGWLDFVVTYEVQDVSLPHSLLLQQREQPYIQTDDYTWVKNDPKAVQKTEKQLQELEALITEQGYRTAVSQFASLEEFIQSIGGRPELSAAYQAFLDQLTGFAPNDQFRLSSRAEADLARIDVGLRPYQRSGIHWLDWLNQNHLHGLLADDMGLGKTLQAICVLRLAYERSLTREHSLILAPKSVLHHWQREIERFYPGIRVCQYHGSQRRSDLFKSLEPIIFISTYATVANDIATVSQVPFYYVILDEATQIKNNSARRTQAVKSLNAAHRLALSGTPVENRPAEIWSLFDFLMRGHLGKQGTFARLFEEKINAGDKKASEQLGHRIKPFMLRRKKEEVAKDLPDKIHMDEWCALSSEQRTLYGSLQDEVQRLRTALQRGENVNYTSSILPVLTKLKQICDHPALVTGERPVTQIDGRSEKFDLIVTKIEEITEMGEQIVLFTHFLGMLSLLQVSLDQRKIRHIRIDGSTNNRQALIDAFNGGKAQVALCSIQATGYGINLTAANHVIHADRWWNPATEDQATDRVHRIGQDKTVYVYRIMVEGTLEEKIDKLLANKRGMADEIVDAARAGERQWTREELLTLLQPLD